jgi:hypothetical protein
MITSFKDIVNLWPTPDAMAAELGAGVETARKWRARNSIPADWWMRVLASRKAIEAGVTAELMTQLAARAQGADSEEERAS